MTTAAAYKTKEATAATVTANVATTDNATIVNATVANDATAANADIPATAYDDTDATNATTAAND